MSTAATPREMSPRRFAALAGTLIAAQLAFRAWGVLPAYFYGDDFLLLREARAHGMSPAALVEPYDSQLMPFGRFVAWLCSLPETPSWSLLAGTSLMLSAAAAMGCAWMLATLFGHRSGTVALLALYLSNAMTVPASTWWAAALNQLPFQVAFFVAVGAWVRHLRGDGRRWLVVTVLALCAGLLAYVKALLIIPVLAFIALAYFATGGPMRRVRSIAGRFWPAVASAALVGGAYLVYYSSHVPSLSTGGERIGPAEAGRLADQMLATSFASGALGGPWRWSADTNPAGLADPPAILIHLSWVAVALIISYWALRRARTGRAWLLLLCYLTVDYLLLLTTRAEQVGPLIGAEYRYLTDSVCVLVLAVGLASTELRGGIQGSGERDAPLLARSIGLLPVALLLAAVTLSGLFSATRYANLWHDGYAGRAVLMAAMTDLRDRGQVDLMTQQMPADIGLLDPKQSRTDVVLGALSPKVRFPDATANPELLTAHGHLATADIEEATATPPGPTAGCGWAVVPGTSVKVPLLTPTIDLGWWARVDYLAGADTGLTMAAGRTERSVDLERGLNRLFVRLDGAYDEIIVSGTDPGVSVCIDKITIGQPVIAADAS